MSDRLTCWEGLTICRCTASQGGSIAPNSCEPEGHIGVILMDWSPFRPTQTPKSVTSKDKKMDAFSCQCTDEAKVLRNIHNKLERMYWYSKTTQEEVEQVKKVLIEVWWLDNLKLVEIFEAYDLNVEIKK
ncbi:MAG: hypothetical protein V3U54_07615 [Thermodesulfobacteriota bacterium]